MEFSRQEYWSGWPFPSPGHLPHPGIKIRSLALQADSLPSEPPESISSVQFSSVQSLSRVRLFATPWTAACQASLSITNSWSLLWDSCPLSQWCHPTISSMCLCWVLAAACRLCFPTRDRTQASCIGSNESQPLDHQGSPHQNPWQFTSKDLSLQEVYMLMNGDR